MEQEGKIIIREASLGPVIARADHLDGAIEVNREIFYRLPPLVQEFVLCHEVCHLKHNEWDEVRTNQLASDLFLSRATSADDRKERQRFLSYLSTGGGYSNFDWLGLALAVGRAGYTIYETIAGNSSGWYSLDAAAQKTYLNTMLKTAFEKSRKTNKKPASEIFWEQMSLIATKDDDLNEFLSRSDNAWTKPVIAKYEKAYGFGFDEVTPIDLTAFPVLMVAAGAIVAFIIYKIIKKRKK